MILKSAEITLQAQRSPRALLHLLAVVAALFFKADAAWEIGTSSECSAEGPGSCAAKEGVDSPPLLIKGGTVVNADREFKADVLIQGGIISKVGIDLPVEAGVQVINAKGKYVMPGGIDPHTHLAMPFMGTESCDDFFSGHAAALAGGTTMHIDFALPTGGDLLKGFADYIEKSARNAAMDYGFHMAVTKWDTKVSADMATLVSKGVNSFKFFLAYKGALQVSDEEFLEGLSRCKELGAIPQVHCENGDAVAWGQKHIFGLGITGPEGHALSRPAPVEGEATRRAITLAGAVGAPLYVVHVMSKDALDEVAKARKAGQRVVGEPVVSGLALDESYLWDSNFTFAAQYVMSPPIRSKSHQAALRGALASGTLQLVATDHCPFNSSQKAKGKGDFRLIPNGVNGIGERMIVTWETMVNSGLISPSDYVRVTSTECSKIFNLYPRKGAILEGSDADVIILDPEATTVISAATHHSRVDTNVYEGWTIKGKIETTISRGRVVWNNGELHLQRGSGRYIPMTPFGSMYQGLDVQEAHRVRSYAKPSL